MADLQAAQDVDNRTSWGQDKEMDCLKYTTTQTQWGLPSLKAALWYSRGWLPIGGHLSRRTCWGTFKGLLFFWFLIQMLAPWLSRRVNKHRILCLWLGYFAGFVLISIKMWHNCGQMEGEGRKLTNRERNATTQREISRRQDSSAFLHALRISIIKHANTFFSWSYKPVPQDRITIFCKEHADFAVTQNTSAYFFPACEWHSQCPAVLTGDIWGSGLQWVHLPMSILCCPQSQVSQYYAKAVLYHVSSSMPFSYMTWPNLLISLPKCRSNKYKLRC